MKRYKFISVTGSASENLADALAGLGEKKRKLHALHANQAIASSIATGTRVRAYKEQDQIVDFAYDSFVNGVSTGTALLDFERRIEIDLTLERGEGFQVGFFNSGSAPTGNITIEYTDLE